MDVVACKHGIRREGDAFLLQVDHQVRNNGDMNSTITSLEAHLVDAQNNLQSQTLNLNIDVGAKTTTAPLKALFSFAPPFPYAQNLKIHFILNHTYGREVFVTDSMQSDI
jgi:hypothetical protein